MVIDPYMPDHQQKAMTAIQSFTRASGPPASVRVGVATEYLLRDLDEDIDTISVHDLLERYDIPASRIQASQQAGDPHLQVFAILADRHPDRARDLAAKVGGQVVELPHGAAFLAPSGALDTFEDPATAGAGFATDSPISLRRIDPEADRAGADDRKGIFSTPEIWGPRPLPLDLASASTPLAHGMGTETLHVERLELGAQPVTLRSLPSGVAITLYAPGFFAVRHAKPSSDLQEIACTSAQQFIDITRKPGFQIDLVYDLASITKALLEETGLGSATTGIRPVPEEGDARSVHEAQAIILASTLKRYVAIFREQAAAASMLTTDLAGKEIIFTADGSREIRDRVG